jgi:hypothetical protein
MRQEKVFLGEMIPLRTRIGRDGTPEECLYDTKKRWPACGRERKMIPFLKSLAAETVNETEFTAR